MLEKETINVVQDGPLVADSEVIEYDTKPRTGEDNVRKFLVEADESAELTEEDSKRLLRKIDYRIMVCRHAEHCLTFRAVYACVLHASISR